jgi:AcrR family transcriptional regulator
MPGHDDTAAEVRAAEATRDRLLAAGMAVLAERGYHAARVDDVARAAGVSHGTFYLYFANKDDLMLGLAEQCVDDLGGLTGQLRSIPSGAEGLAEVRAWLADFVAHYRDYGVVIRSWVENQSTHPELTRLGIDTFAGLAEGLAERLAVAHPHDTALRVAALISLIERFTYLVVSHDLGDEERVLDTAAAVIHRSFFAAA